MTRPLLATTLSSLQSFYLIPTIDKPTRVRSSFANLIVNIFINNPDQVVTWGNIVSDISDHFSQFYILKSVKDKVKVNKFKVPNCSQFSANFVNAELSQVDWNAIVETKSYDVNDLFSSFHNKFNKLVNKHAPMKTISNRKAKQCFRRHNSRKLRQTTCIQNREGFAVHSSTWPSGAKDEWRVSSWLAISTQVKKYVVTAFLRAGNPCVTPQFMW